jgi:hypothetical protein
MTFEHQKGRKALKSADGIHGRTNYMKYRNSQNLLEKYINEIPDKFISRYQYEGKEYKEYYEEGFWDPDVLEAIVLSYAYEGMQGFKTLSHITDTAMKKWLVHYKRFLVYIGGIGWQYRIGEFPSKKEQHDAVEKVISNWENLSKSQKIMEFEKLRNFMHYSGYIIADIYQWEREESEEFMANLSFLLK